MVTFGDAETSMPERLMCRDAMKRDWTAAIDKCEKEGTCRICRRGNPEPAHLWHRGLGGSMDADNIVPLCRTHHHLFDSHRIDLLPYLSEAEQIRLVQETGSIETARRRVLPSEY